MDQVAQPGAEQAPAPQAIVERSAGGEGALSIRDAANSLVDTRRKDNAQAEQAPEGDAKPAKESAPQGEDAGPETVPGETQEQDQAAETLSPIEPPRSWTKEDKELFKGLPRETQERLADRERSRESDASNVRTKPLKSSKASRPKSKQAEQVRAQYEPPCRNCSKPCKNSTPGSFPTSSRCRCREDGPRGLAPLRPMGRAAEEGCASVRKCETAKTPSHEKQQKWQTFASEQDALFLEKAPEFADKDKAAKAHESASELLQGSASRTMS
jgi:hypothetical protein